MAIDFGSDYSTFRPDGTYGQTYVRITGPRVPLEGVGRAWLTDPASMFWKPEFGIINVARLENAAHNERELGYYASFLAKAAKQVDFVSRASVTVTYAGTTLTVSGYITLTDGSVHPLLVTAAQAAQVVVQFPSSSLTSQ